MHDVSLIFGYAARLELGTTCSEDGDDPLAWFRRRQPKLIPDEVFAASPFLQRLQAAGLYDQDSASNLWPIQPDFHLIPEPLFTELGEWSADFMQTDFYRLRIAPRNAIQLPQAIVMGMRVEGRRIDQPLPAYVDFVRDGVRNCVDTAATQAKVSAVSNAEGNEFYRCFCITILALIDFLAPRVNSGEFPLSYVAPGVDRSKLAPKA
jgi:hypothetical protein